MSDLIITVNQNPPIVVVMTNPSATMDMVISTGEQGVPGVPGQDGVAEAAVDGSSYVRKDGAWTLETVYTHPATHAPTIITQDASNRFVSDSEKAEWSGKADLVGGVVPASQLPAYRDEIVWVDTASNLPATGIENLIYITKDTNAEFRWSGSAYSEISPSVSLGETSSTAFRGDRGKTAYDHSQAIHAPATADQNVQADWAQVDTGADNYIKNVPTNFPPSTHTHSGYEPSLGNPAEDGMILVSTAAGVRGWAGVSGGGIDWTAPVAVTAEVTLTVGKHHVCSGTTVPYQIALPAASGNGGKLISVEMGVGLAKLVTLKGNGAELIDGSNTRIMWAKETAVLLCDGTGWTKIYGKTLPMFGMVAAFSMNQLWAADTNAKVLCNTFMGDCAHMDDITNNRLVAPRGGVHTLEASICFGSANSTTTRMATVAFVNGVQKQQTLISAYRLASTAWYVKSTSNIVLPGGCYAELYGYYQAGTYTTTTITNSSNLQTFMSLTEVPSW